MRRRHVLANLPLLGAGCGRETLLAGAHGADDGGIGGTGLLAAQHGPDDGGIGGTGIFGVVTGTGSLRLNGLRLERTDSTNFETLGDLPAAPGDTVAAEARREGDRLVATRIANFFPLIGTLDRAADGGWAVLGTSLVVAPDTPVRDRAGATIPLATLRAGQPVAVSGLWRDATVVATSLRLLEAAPVAVVRGLLRRRGAVLVVGGTVVDADRPPPTLERFVTLQGRPGPRGLVVASLETRPLGVFDTAVRALSVEGFVAPNRDAPGFHLAGFGLPLDPSSPAAPRPGERRLLLGRHRALFRVEDQVALPERAAARTQALADPATAAANRRWLDRA